MEPASDTCSKKRLAHHVPTGQQSAGPAQGRLDIARLIDKAKLTFT